MSAPNLEGRFYPMDILQLVSPAPAHESQAMAFKAELLAENGAFDGCAGLSKVETYRE